MRARRVTAWLVGGALLTAVVAAATSLLISARLSNEEALLADMDTVITAVSDEAVENTESYLRPASQTADLIAGLIADGLLDPDADAAERVLLGILASNPTYDGLYVGGNDGTFLYVNRLQPSDEGTIRSKRISFPDGERLVELAYFDDQLNALKSRLDPTDDYDPRERVWFENARSQRSGGWTDPYVFFTSMLPGVTRSTPVIDEFASIDHVVGVDMRIAELSRFMAERRPSDGGGAFIMTRSQAMVAYPDVEAIGDGTELRTADEIADEAVVLAGGRIGDGVIGPIGQASAAIDVADDGAQFVFTPLEANPDWVVTAWAPHADFLSEVRETSRTNTVISIALGAVILVELLGAVLWVTRRMSQNQRALHASVEAEQRSTAERDRAETELARTVRLLEASNRDLEQYAYAAAHDLRTPLRAIGGYSELIGRELEAEAPDAGKLRGWADRIVEGYDRMGRTMDNLLQHARLAREGLEPEEVDATLVAQRVVDDVRPVIDRAFGRVVIGELPRAMADPVQLSRVFQNLVENAIRFRHPDRPLRIDIVGEVEGSTATFRVVDNGLGISAEDGARIFETFEQGRADPAGIGLGLALVKRIVEDHGGRIRVESEEDQGAIFEFTLPAAEEPAPVVSGSR